MRTYVIAVGNAYRGDDAAGFRVAKALRDAKALPPANIKQCDGNGTDILDFLRGAERVFLVDAADSDDTPGTVHRIDAGSETLPRDWFARNSHTFGLAEAVETARSLDELPEMTTVYAIVGSRWDHGSALSPEVAKACDSVAKQIAAELSQRG